ncbi:MAG: hypothetical protein ACRDSR_15330 [Pseudonocardiaceae bacterium]
MAESPDVLAAMRLLDDCLVLAAQRVDDRLVGGDVGVGDVVHQHGAGFEALF